MKNILLAVNENQFKILKGPPILDVICLLGQMLVGQLS